jgi:hypothetical protein
VMGPKNRALITTTEQQWPHPTSFVPNAGPSGMSWFRSHVGRGGGVGDSVASSKGR